MRGLRGDGVEFLDAWSSSEDSIARGAKGRGTASRAVRESDSKEFQPDAVDESRCQALLLNRGYGKLQCCAKPVRGSEFCSKHSRRLLWGRVTGALSQEVLSKFWRTKLKGRPEE